MGDEVLAYNEYTGEVSSQAVTATLRHVDEVIVYLTIDGETIETTPEHPFYTSEGEWIPAGELTEGDRIQDVDGSFGTVDAVRQVERDQEMYNLTVANDHTFFVGEGEWLVHNSCKKVPYSDGFDLASLARRYRVDNNPLPNGERFTQGNVAIFEYINKNGRLDRLVMSNLPKEIHAELRVANRLKSMGINPDQITRVYSELKPCTSRGSNCLAFLEMNYPQADIFYSYDYTEPGRFALREAIDILLE